MANLWQSSFPTYVGPIKLPYIGLYSFTMFSPTPSIDCMPIMEGRFTVLCKNWGIDSRVYNKMVLNYDIYCKSTLVDSCKNELFFKF